MRKIILAIEKENCRTNLNKPIYIGTGILDLGKLLMQDFHHNYLKNKYGDKSELFLKDTDKLIHKIEAENFFEFFFLQR